jgi:AcrR family transcriptional regulator
MSGGGRVDRGGVASMAMTAVRDGRVGAGGQGVAEIQRARLLAAMADVVCEHGAGNVTVAHVVERAGISRRTFYELFEDRDECFLAAFDEGVALVSRCVLAVYEPEAKWAERIRSALTAVLDFLDAEPSVGWLLVVGSLGAGAKVLERRREVLARAIVAVDAGRGEGKAGAGLASLTAEGIVGAVSSVIHGRMIENGHPLLIELVNPLMSMAVMPYLGPGAAGRELEKPVSKQTPRPVAPSGDPLRGLPMRITYRTVRVLMALAENPGSSNRQLGEAAGIGDQGQISKLLGRLDRLGLVENSGPGHRSGECNVWTLTAKGQEIEQAVGSHRVG